LKYAKLDSGNPRYRFDTHKKKENGLKLVWGEGQLVASGHGTKDSIFKELVLRNATSCWGGGDHRYVPENSPSSRGKKKGEQSLPYGKLS